jgi:hypothetical protein
MADVFIDLSPMLLQPVRINTMTARTALRLNVFFMDTLLWGIVGTSARRIAYDTISNVFRQEL